MLRLLLAFSLLFCFSLCGELPAQDLEDEFPPGLLARYTSGSRSIERIDDRIAFVWNDSAPDLRLPGSPFNAEWTALQLIRKNDTYRYALYLAGDAELFLDGKSILKASSNKPAWFESEPVELRFGEHDFKLTYRKSSPEATLKLYWSSNAYPLEPVPRESFFREESHPKSKLFDAGQRQFVSRRCANCHQTDLPLPELAAPSLENIENSLSADWIVGKLTDPEQTEPHGKMPRFGFNDEDAQAIAAYLLDRARPADLQELPKSKDKNADLTEGERLFHSRGCLACHQMNGLGNDDAFAGSALDKIAAKRSPDWIFTWLTSPEKLNRDHRMPLIELAKDERRQLTVYLSSKGEAPGNPAKPEASKLAQQGKELITKARCANCHRIRGIEADRKDLPSLASLKPDPGCVTRKLSLTAPSYESQQLDRPAMADFTQQMQQTSPPMQVSQQARGELLLETKNCIQCHPRGRSQGIVAIAGKVSKSLESLRGESEAMIPPSLDAVGDKLQDEALLKSVSGEQPRRMDWLHIRMPNFKHSKEEAQLLAETFIAEDRIPDGAPDPHIFTVQDDQKTSPEELLTSNTLVGPRGFSCVACHSLGDYKPRNVALGTRGSNLLDIGKRMRSSYFIRWTRAPIRIVPGMEMPSIGHKPVPGILDADIDRQLAVIWKGINDPDFTIPTDPASVEQFWVVAPEHPARVIRDVFELSKETGDGYVARALAVGFNNQHSILFDLDLFEPRVWTYGDFARQKTAGKSWYWNMAGVPVKAWKSSGGGFRILRGGALVEAAKDNSQIGELRSYRPSADGIELTYSLWFDSDVGRERIDVREVWKPVHDSPQGWRRTIFTDAKKRPDHPEVVLMLPETELDRSGEVSVLPANRVNTVKSERFALVGDQLSVTYRKSLSEPFLPPKPKPVIINEATPITSAPGFDGVRLPLRGDIMPTGICWDAKGRMLFTSLKGDLFRAIDSDHDGVEDHLDLLAEGLSAPYGVIAYRDNNLLEGGAEKLLVAQKPEVLELSDSNGDGTYEERRVFATGWGFSENYHDWTCGFARDEFGNFYVGLGSDYSQKDRPQERSRWRGSVLRIAYDSSEITPIAHSFRYPTGVAIDPKGRLFATDNQGVQNTFNELNHLQVGKYYGVPSRHEENPDAPITPPAIQIPHPWVRSVNGLAFVPDDIPALAPLAGHGIGCEYNSRLLVRFTLQEVDGILQGATYYFTKPIEQATPDNFIGPISIGISKQGEISIGSILDSGWLGGQNIGAIAKLTPQKVMPNGLRELTATKDGFRLKFFQPVDRSAAVKTENYSISGYTREWAGSYATPDKDRHRADVTSAKISKDGRTVHLVVEGRREGFVYEVTAQNLSTDETPLFPETGHFTLHRIPGTPLSKTSE